MKSKNKNLYISKLLKEEGIRIKRKFYYKRIGKCDYKKCMSACCRFNCLSHWKTESKDYQKMSDLQQYQGVQTKSINGNDFYITPRLCLYISFNGKCELHNKRTQPRVCKYFPMHQTDGVYLALQHICGYKFIKIKNTKKRVRSTKNDTR